MIPTNMAPTTACFVAIVRRWDDQEERHNVLIWDNELKQPAPTRLPMPFDLIEKVSSALNRYSSVGVNSLVSLIPVDQFPPYVKVLPVPSGSKIVWTDEDRPTLPVISSVPGAMRAPKEMP